MTNFIENSVFLGAVLSLVAYEAGIMSTSVSSIVRDASLKDVFP